VFREVMKCGTGLDAGIPGHGTDIEYLMAMPTEAMAMISLGELCPERGRQLFWRNGKDA
jgi:hypothetical protein